MRQAAELEEAHDHAGAELLHVRSDLAGHVVGVADEREPFLLRQVEVEFVQRQLLRGSDDGRPRSWGQAEQLHRAAVVAQELLPEVVEMRLGLLPRLRVRLGHVDVTQHEAVLGRRRPAVACRGRTIRVENDSRPRE